MSKIGVKKWDFLPLIFILSILVVLTFDSIKFDIIAFKESKSIAYKLFLFFLAFSPLLLLTFFDHWKKLAFHEKFLVVGLSAFMIAINYRVHLAFQFSAIFALATAYYFYRERKVYRPSHLSVFLFIYVLINAVSLFWTSDVAMGIQLLGHLSPLVYTPLLFCFFRLDSKKFDLVALFVFRMMMFYATYSICSWLIEARFVGFAVSDSFISTKYLVNGIYPYDAAYAWTNQSEPTYSAVILIITLAVGWYYVGREVDRDRISYFELLFYILATLLLAVFTASRFMLVVWALVNLLGGLHFVKNNRKVFFVLSSLSLGCTLLFGTLFHKKADNFLDDPIREYIYEAAFESIRQHTFYGVGLGGMRESLYADEEARTLSGAGSLESFPHRHPHNQMVSDFMQTGVFGLFILLCVIGSLLRTVWLKRNWLLGMCLVVYFLAMCIETPLIHSKGIFLFALIFSFLAHRDLEKNM